MNKIEEMIKKLCPNGVEYKELSELCDISRGKRLTKSELIENGKYAVYHGSISPLGQYDKANQEKDTIIIINTGSIGEIGYSEKAYWCSDACFSIQSCTIDILNNKFLYYYLIQFKNYFISRIRKGGVPTIDKDCIAKIKIPVPPIAVQQEIVKVLDTFSELTAELTARKKQYAYYKHKLLSFENLIDLSPNGVEYKELSELLDYIQSTKYKVNSIEYSVDYKTPVLTAGKTFILGYTNELNNIFSASKNNPVIIFDDFTTDIKWVDFPFKVKSSAMKILLSKNNVNIRYVFYAMQCIYYAPSEHSRQWISKYSKIKIPVPPLEVQEYIVNILDKFDSLVNDIMVGLPAEIAARQKQYAYYRDKLLTFASLK